jgi:hypothetical protein
MINGLLYYLSKFSVFSKTGYVVASEYNYLGIMLILQRLLPKLLSGKFQVLDLWGSMFRYYSFNARDISFSFCLFFFQNL